MAMRVSGLRVFVHELEGCVEFFGARLGLALNRALVGRFTGISFAVDDIAAEHSRLAAAGVPFDGAPELQAWGGWLATLRDPAGNQFQLVSYPKPAS
jgi:predicted enzyme related to lactoylglutathione lyase